MGFDIAAHEVADTAGFEGAGGLKILEFEEDATGVRLVQAETVVLSKGRMRSFGLIEGFHG